MSLPRHLQQLEARLTGLATLDDGGPMLLSELDGFLAGILVCPERIMPNEWLPVALGQEDEEADTFDGDDALLQDTIRLVFKHYDTLGRQLQRDDGRYRPVFDVSPRHDEVLWELWMGGFARAMALRPESWLSIPPDGDDQDAALAMAGIMALSMIANSDEGIAADPAQTEELTEAAPDLIPEWIETLHAWRVRNSTDPPQQAVSTKVGRNEPCPCGLGRKYKKCCAMN
jgi:uncharacterized protein